MQTEPTQNPEQSVQDHETYKHIPFDGFVNVNDIVRKRRQLRNVEFNVSDQCFDADFNPISEGNKPADQGTD